MDFVILKKHLKSDCLGHVYYYEFTKIERTASFVQNSYDWVAQQSLFDDDDDDDDDDDNRILNYILF